jgi:competence protein ComEC
VLDVGQGLASVVQTKNYILIYDTGPLDGKTVLLPYLQSRGIQQIDKLVISHADADHRNGAASLLASLSAAQILVGENIRELPKQSLCYQGQQWQWDGVFFEIIHPDVNPRWEGNNRSCVLRIKTENHQILLTGDIQKPVESHLLKNLSESLASDIIVVPHHGSKTSSSLAFLEVVKPQYAIVPAGFLSQYGHPHKDVLANYEAIDAQLYYTAHQGAIHVKIAGTELNFTAHRDHYRRWWH